MDNNQLASKEEFDHQQKELEKLCFPIVSKMYGSGEARDSTSNGTSGHR